MNNDSKNVVRIQLAKGYEAVVDHCDGDLAQYNWHASEMSSGAYAHRWICSGNTKKVRAMHRQILERKIGRPIKRGFHCDHINHNTLDNRRDNLREVSQSVNLHNSNTARTNSSGVKGVSWYKRARKWQATITINRKFHHLGYYDTIEEAHAAYIEMKRKHGLIPPLEWGVRFVI